ncbi:MAG: chloramphenicol-sensitive protein RarD [Flavobacteriales bacterium]|jgi:chloramphenicol-sensitive protein RarD
MYRQKNEVQQGMLLALFSYCAWGFLPLYFKSLSDLSSVDILIHRIVWSTLLTLVMVIVAGKLSFVLSVFTSLKKLWPFVLSALLLSANWLIYIYATLHHDIMQISLGYFINPILNMLFGMVIFSERVGRLSKLAMMLAGLGLLVRLSDFEHFPWLALGIALAFSLYGVVRKKAKADAASGLFIETSVLLIPALAWMFFVGGTTSFELMNNAWDYSLLLMMAGPVTTIPLIAFSLAVKKIPYYLMGFCQYLTPSILLLLAIFLYDEAWTRNELLTFGLVWIGIVLALSETFYRSRTREASD